MVSLEANIEPYMQGNTARSREIVNLKLHILISAMMLIYEGM